MIFVCPFAAKEKASDSRMLFAASWLKFVQMAQEITPAQFGAEIGQVILKVEGTPEIRGHVVISELVRIRQVHPKSAGFASLAGEERQAHGHAGPMLFVGCNAEELKPRFPKIPAKSHLDAVVAAQKPAVCHRSPERIFRE